MMSREAVDMPSSRRLLRFCSARDTETAAAADSAVRTRDRSTTATTARTSTVLRDVRDDESSRPGVMTHTPSTGGGPVPPITAQSGRRINETSGLALGAGPGLSLTSCAECTYRT